MLIAKNSTINVENQINEFENLLQMTLPRELKIFLIKYNGGETPKTCFKNGKISTDIRAFYGLGKVLYSYDKVDIVKKDEKVLLPIAIDSFGNSFLLSMNFPHDIYFEDHEKGDSMVLVAKSLKEFISMCDSEIINEAARRSPEEREKILISNGKGKNISQGLKQMWQEEYEKYRELVQERVEI